MLAIHQAGVDRQIRGVLFGDDPCPTCSTPWPVMSDGNQVGQITSAIWSPRLKRNVGLSLIENSHWDEGQSVSVNLPDGGVDKGMVSSLPFA